MTTERDAETHALFDELMRLDEPARRARAGDLARDEIGRDVLSLLDAAERGGDFLGVLADAIADARLAPGQVVCGRYRLDRRLGRGAMGDVHLAWDGELERPVALKFVRATDGLPSGGSGGDALARLLGEARAAARLEHPHVATVYDVGASPEHGRYIAMAYYPGATLRARMAGGALPARDAVRIAAQLAGALAAAHAAGIVHRDVKPENVLFDGDGGARLADFGVALLAAERSADRAHDARGTPAYLSPEQARGEPASPAADLWALGVLLHEMLTGRRPVVAGDARSLLRSLATDEPLPLAPELAELAPALHAVVSALLAKDPRARPGDAGDVRRALVDLLESEAAHPTHAPNGHGALPEPATSLVGRTRELAACGALLGATRLITLTGPGGTGKSRLAVALAAAHRDRFAGGVWFVPLAGIASAPLVPSAVAHALGVRDLGGAPVAERVIGAIGARRALLVLDNFEHVLGAASFVADLLAACPAATVLVTSRAPLGVQGEHLFAVPPLPTPRAGDDDLAANDAVRLFVARARAVDPSFEPAVETLETVASICRRLDGLPLALELAAARAKLLGPRAMLARLQRRLDLLRSDAPDRPARHATMRAVIDWSFVLLTDAERALFCRLAVFAGGATLGAVEAVAAPAIGASSALDLVDSLRARSLLASEEQSDGEPRLSMLETIREFGLERLHEGDDEPAARRAHRAYFVAFAERGAARLRGPGQAAAFDALERDYANLRVALDGALADGRDGVDDAGRLAVALHRLWLTRGPLFEGIDYVRRALAAAESTTRHAGHAGHAGHAALRARLLASAAQLAGTRSVFPEARDLFARALVAYRELDDRAGVAATLNNLAWQTWIVGDLAGGAALSREALAIHGELGDALGVALSRNNLAWIEMEQADFDAAEAHFAAVIDAHERRGDARAAAFATSWLGVLAARRGDFTRAAGLHERALVVGDPVADAGYRVLVLVRLAAARHALDASPGHAVEVETLHLPALREFGRLWPLGYALTTLGEMRLDHGDARAARSALEEALDARVSSGDAGGAAEARMLIGVAHLIADEAEAAAARLGDALAGARAYGAPLLLAECVRHVASLALAAGRAERAAVLLGAAARERDARGVRRGGRAAASEERSRAAVRAAAGAAFEAAWRSGLAMPLASAAALAAAEVAKWRTGNATSRSAADGRRR